MSDSSQPHGLVAYQAPPSMGFSRQDYWSGLPFPFPGVFPTQGSNLGLLHCRQTLYHLSHKGASPLVSTISNLHSVSTVSRIEILFSELKSALSLNHSKVGSYFPNISFKAGKTKTKTKTPDTIVKEKWNKHREI